MPAEGLTRAAKVCGVLGAVSRCRGNGTVRLFVVFL